MRYSSRVDRISGSSVSAWDIHLAARKAKLRGDNVILLSVGDPDFPTPAPIVEAAVSALRAGDTHYTEILGRYELRRSIAERHSRLSGQEVSAENVIVLGGAQNSLFSVAQCLFEKDDEVVTLEPTYLTYHASVGASGATLIPVPLSVEKGMRLDTQSLAAAITPKTRAFYFANPNNPTGVVMTHEELEAIADLARRHDLWIVADEVYAELTFEAPHVSIGALPGMAERCVTIGSLSKSHAMTGWRMGWTIAPTALIEHMSNLSLCMLYGLPGFVMQGALKAIAESDTVTAEMRAVYRRRRDLVFDLLSEVPGLRCAKPEAGMFMLVDVRATGLSAHDFSWSLFREEGVSVLDASAFGESAEGHVRLSFTLSDEQLAEACRRLARFVRGSKAAETFSAGSRPPKFTGL
ncbi:pyridoxal phosphate-dependent aminotransferase [Bradyrhizobium sp. USDA 3650]